METELEQLRQQLAAANARIEELQRMAHVGEMFVSLIGKTVERRHDTVEALTVETMLDWIDRAKKAESTIAALTERAERAEKIVEMYKEIRFDIKPSGISLNGFTDTARKMYKINQAVNEYDTARREAGRDATDSAVARVEGER